MDYSTTNRVAYEGNSWYGGQPYCRDAYCYYICNTGQGFTLYNAADDAMSTTAGGTYQTGIGIAWQTRKQATIKVAVVDSTNDIPSAPHGVLVANTIKAVAHCPVDIYHQDTFWATNLARSMWDAINSGARLINCSWLIYEKDPVDIADLKAAFEEAQRRQIIVVCGADNRDRNLDEQHSWGLLTNYPAFWQLSNVIVVGCVDMAGKRFASDWSTNYIHLAAPGAYIVTENVDGSMVYISGTSFATAIVSGCMALALSQFHDFPPIEVRDWLLSNASRYGDAEMFKHGLLDMASVITPELRLKAEPGFVVVPLAPEPVQLEHSLDMQAWTGQLVTNTRVPAMEGFYRVRL